MNLTKVVGIILVTATLAAGSRSSVADPPKLRWTHSFNAPARNDAIDCMVITNNGKSIVVVELTSDPMPQPVQGEFQLVSFSENGDLQSKSVIKVRPPELLTVPHPKGHAAAIFPQDDGSSLVLGRFNDDSIYSIVKLENGEVRFSHDVSRLVYGSMVRGVLNSRDGKMLVIGGSALGSGIAVEFDGEGEVVWSREYRRPVTAGDDSNESELHEIDLLAEIINGQDDTTLVAAAQTGLISKFGTGPLKLRLMSCDREGKVLHETQMKGRTPLLGRSTNGQQFFMLYDTEQDFNAKYSLAAFDWKFHPLWELNNVVQSRFGPSPAVAPTADGGCVIAVAKSDQLMLIQYSASGDLVENGKYTLIGNGISPIRIAYHDSMIVVGINVVSKEDSNMIHSQLLCFEVNPSNK